MGPPISTDGNRKLCGVPTDWKSWSRRTYVTPDDPTHETLYQTTKSFWTELQPFFATRGYALYEPNSFASSLPPTSFKSPYRAKEAYPYARHRVRNDEELFFAEYQCMRIWAARDRSGQEVMIRLVSTPEGETDELRIYRRLNSPEARKDPRSKRTLPVLEFVVHEGLTFVIMPRWGRSTQPRFTTVEEVLGLAQHLFEGLAFLHDMRIAHRDIALQNTVMNALYNECNVAYYRATSDIRKTSETMYAFIDYDAAAIFPMNADINSEEMVLDRQARYGPSLAGVHVGKGNPFKDDVVVLGDSLEGYVRVVEEVVPEIGPFFDAILKNKSNPPSAAQAFRNLSKIRDKVHRKVLDSPPPGAFWDDGQVRPYFELN